MNTKLSALALAAALIPLAHAEPPTPEFTSGGISSRTSPQQPVGTTVKAEADARAQDAATDIASITADRGIVTRPGRFTIEPSLSDAHSNATRVAIECYTVIRALLMVLFSIWVVQPNIFVGAVSLKYGFTSRFEAGIRVPYLCIKEDYRER